MASSAKTMILIVIESSEARRGPSAPFDGRFASGEALSLGVKQ
jgi:hypothetical protein